MEIANRFKLIGEIHAHRKEEDAKKLANSGQSSKNQADPTDPNISGEESEDEDRFLEFSNIERHVLIDVETATPKEVCHIIAAHMAMIKYMPHIIESYKDDMESFRQKVALDTPFGSWAPVLPDNLRKSQDSYLNEDLDATNPSMPHIFHELGQGIETAYEKLVDIRKQFPNFNFETCLGNPTRV